MRRVISSSQHRESWGIWVSHPEEPGQVDASNGWCVWTVKLHQRGAPPSSEPDLLWKGAHHGQPHWLSALVSCSWTWDAALLCILFPIHPPVRQWSTVLICAFYVQMPTQFRCLNLGFSLFLWTKFGLLTIHPWAICINTDPQPSLSLLCPRGCVTCRTGLVLQLWYLCHMWL